MNEYYTPPDAPVAGTRVRSSKISEIIESIDDGFDNIPVGLATTIESLTAESGVLVTDNDQTVGKLDTKLIPSDGIQFILNNAGGNENYTVRKLGWQKEQGVNLFYKTSDSPGIRVPYNALLDLSADTPFTIITKFKLRSLSAAAYVFRYYISTSNRFYCNIATGGTITFRADVSGAGVFYYATGAYAFELDTEYELVFTTDRNENTYIYLNRVVLDYTTITADTGVAISLSKPLTVGGTISASSAIQIFGYAQLNRYLTEEEVSEYYKNGLSFRDRLWAGATNSGSVGGFLISGYRYRITSFEDGDDFTNIGAASNATGVEFIATGETPTTWTNGTTLTFLGAVINLEPENIQPAPSLWLDSSYNALHAKLPVNAVLLRPKNEFFLKWTLTWSASSTARYIGGYEEAILPSNAIITDIFCSSSGAGIQDIEIGLSTDANYYVTSVTPSGSYQKLTIAGPSTGATAKEILVTPAGSATMTLVLQIKGFILVPELTIAVSA